VKHRIAFINLPLVAVFLVLASTTALASSTWYVDGVHGSDNNNCKSPQTACKTVGHAISLAHSGDSIKVAPATYTDNTLTIRFSLKIIGSDASTTIIDGGGVNTVVTISNANAHVALSKLTITKGFAYVVGGGIRNSGTLIVNNSMVSGNSALYGGGGILNNGALTINNSTLSGNGAGRGSRSVAVNYQAPALPSGFGGGILNNGTLTINNSTVSRNSATSSPGGAGGGIWSNNRALTINNSTLSGNSASHDDGGIVSGGALTINNSTISGNSASGTIGGIDNSSGTATLQNSIVANNSPGGNCSGTMTSNGYNLSSDNTCNFNGTGDLNNVDPKLGQLGNHGGPTQTIPLLSGSPAIDAGNPNGCTDDKGHLLKTDQRGRPRPDREDKSGCDMGAYEEQSQPKCIPLGDPCFGPGPLKCCPAFPRHTFCSSKTGYGYCLID
jgi:hypothetical protein